MERQDYKKCLGFLCLPYTTRGAVYLSETVGFDKINNGTGGYVMNIKAALIVTAIVALATGLVFLILYGVGGREDLKTTIPLPTDGAAKAYVLDKKLLVAVNEVKTINAGGPNFTMLQGTDEAGNDKLVWLTGKDNKIIERGSILVKEGVVQDIIMTKLKEKNITSDKIQEIFISPYDYTSGRIVWFVKEKDIRNHMLSYDFKTGEFLWEVYQDPTAWKL
jgi:uncharacterized protein YpmB